VLPFANLSGDEEQDYFVDGVTESLTTDLSRMRGIPVIGRKTALPALVVFDLSSLQTRRSGIGRAAMSVIGAQASFNPNRATTVS
jgi:TolB-like protein